MGTKLKTIREYCNDCNGEGMVSSCCHAEHFANRCGECGKFCRSEPCHECHGQGYEEYSIGDEVVIFLCVYSEKYLLEQFNYKPKKLGDNKTFEGEIVEFIDKFNANVKINKKIYNVKIQDLEVR